MEKNFNEEELSDIMKEIQVLEENLNIEEANLDTKDNSVSKEKVVEISHQNSGENLLEISSQKKIEFPRTSPPTSMSFKVSGDLKLQLHFEINGQKVDLVVDESGLNLTLDNGAFFRVPLKKSA